MSRRELAALGAAACVACCAAPILGVVGGIGALGLVSSLFIGAAGFVIAIAAGSALAVLRRRAHAHETGPAPELSKGRRTRQTESSEGTFCAWPPEPGDGGRRLVTQGRAAGRGALRRRCADPAMGRVARPRCPALPH